MSPQSSEADDKEKIGNRTQTNNRGIAVRKCLYDDIFEDLGLGLLIVVDCEICLNYEQSP